jgi:hypothetical protein
MLHVVAVTDFIVDHLTESREADVARARHQTPRTVPAPRASFLGGFTRALFGARA